MKRNNIKQAITLANMLPGGNVYTKTDTYINLLKYAKALSRIDVHACNGTKYQDENSQRVATEKIYQKINQALKDTSINFYHQSDPRGVSLYVGKDKLTQLNYNNYLAIY